MMPPAAPVRFSLATEADIDAIANLGVASARTLTQQFGPGHWSREPTAGGVRNGLRHAKTVVGRVGADIVCVARLARKKPWAIDVSYFTACRQPLYLTDMAVLPARRGQGVGRSCLVEVLAVARAWPGDAVRLDAYDAPAGAGRFYERCGFAPRGGVTYRGVPLLYFERLLG